MSCVWKGLIQKLDLKYKPLTLYNLIKSNNIKTINVMCNGIVPTESQLDENYERIECLTQKEVTDGYFCSAFDPLLFLVCQLYKVKIVHNFNHTTITYEYKNDEEPLECEKIRTKKKKSKKGKHEISTTKKVLTCFSDSGHFW